MCFELDSVPPIPPISGGAPVRSEDVVLEAADGTRLAAFAAHRTRRAGRHRHPPRRPRAVPLLRGARAPLRRARLRRRRVRLLRAHRRRRKRDDEFPYTDHVAQTTAATIQQDVGAAVAHLRSPGAAARRRSSRWASASAAGTLARDGRRPRARRCGRVLRSTGERNGDRARPTARPSSTARSSRSRPATTRTSCPSTTPLSTRRSRPQASSTRSSSTPARRTASSTASRRTTPRVRRRLEADARVHRAPHTCLRPAQRSGRRGALHLSDDPSVPRDPQDEPEAEPLA